MYRPLAKLFGAFLDSVVAQPTGGQYPVPREEDRVYCFCTLCGNAWARRGCTCHESWMRRLPDDLQEVADAAYRMGSYDGVRPIEEEAYQRWVGRTPRAGD